MNTSFERPATSASERVRMPVQPAEASPATPTAEQIHTVQRRASARLRALVFAFGLVDSTGDLRSVVEDPTTAKPTALEVAKEVRDRRRYEEAMRSRKSADRSAG